MVPTLGMCVGTKDLSCVHAEVEQIQLLPDSK